MTTRTGGQSGTTKIAIFLQARRAAYPGQLPRGKAGWAQSLRRAPAMVPRYLPPQVRKGTRSPLLPARFRLAAPCAAAAQWHKNNCLRWATSWHPRALVAKRDPGERHARQVVGSSSGAGHHQQTDRSTTNNPGPAPDQKEVPHDKAQIWTYGRGQLLRIHYRHECQSAP